jgi:hypothetical protein
MKRIKQFDEFITEKNTVKDIKIGIDELLDVINNNQLDLIKTFNLDGKNVTEKDNISKLYSDSQFNKNLDKKKLKKGKLQDTKDSETLLDDNYVLRFFFVYDKDSIELEEPKYILVQYYNKSSNEVSEILLFDNDESINKFYEMLTDKTIEIQRGKKEYVYQTNNSGNNWELKNPNQVKGKFKDELDADQVDDLLKDKKIKLNK